MRTLAGERKVFEGLALKKAGWDLQSVTMYGGWIITNFYTGEEKNLSPEEVGKLLDAAKYCAEEFNKVKAAEAKALRTSERKAQIRAWEAENRLLYKELEKAKAEEAKAQSQEAFRAELAKNKEASRLQALEAKKAKEVAMCWKQRRVTSAAEAERDIFEDLIL